MYYLQSRYYDPNVGRFINADEAIVSIIQDSILQHNFYTYCCNNVVNMIDPLGCIGAEAAALSFVSSYGMAYAGVTWATLIAKLTSFLIWVAPYLIATIAVVAVAILIYYASKSKSKKTKIPSKLKSGNKVKTPSSHPGEFDKKKGGGYKHKKTDWNFEKSKDGHYKGDHWHASPKNGKTGDYYNVSPEGIVLS